MLGDEGSEALTGESAPIDERLVEVPYGALSPQALRGVIEAFVLREGTDYGEREVSLDVKVAQVMERLERGEARIVFDPATRSVDIWSSESCPAPHSRRSGSSGTEP